MPRLTLLPRPGHPRNRDGLNPRRCALVVDVTLGVSVLDAASDHGFLIATRCGGVVDCKTCRVEVPIGTSPEEGLSEIDEDEADALAEVHASPRTRLACQARVLADVEVFVPNPADMEEE
jgi:2Fe-2S ferredoxin